MLNRLLWGCAAVLGVAMAASGQAFPVTAVPQPLTLPAGFHISVYAQHLQGVRMMALSPRGDLVVSRPRAGEVDILSDRSHRGRPDISVLAGDLDRPHGLAWRGNDLYVAETGAIVRLNLSPDGCKAVSRHVIAHLPPGGMHWSRTIGFGPDGKLYASIGSDCNVCEEGDPRRATIQRMSADGSGMTTYAKGLRNAVGFTWDPSTKRMWATDNGRDMLGNDRPPDELDEVLAGGDYGWPFCNGDQEPDPRFGRSARYCKRTVPMALGFQAHSASLGIHFYTGTQFPREYRNDAFVAFHGSWNRTPPTGYKVVRVRFRDGKPIGYQDFVSGWLRGDSAWGRPVDVLTAPDGSLFITDDAGGRIYRVTYAP